MRALAVAERGAQPSVIDVPDVPVGPGQVRVQVTAASINGFDLAVAAGRVWDFMPHTFPVTIGRDYAGVVEAVAGDVNSVAVGDIVAGVNVLPGLGAGTVAETFTVGASTVTPVPQGVTAVQAAAVGLAGVTAVDLLDALSLAAGDTVLISGATGGLGGFAVQLAAAGGAHVMGTARPGAGADHVRSLGAHEVVDYTGDLAAAVRAIVAEGVSKVAQTAGDAAVLGSVLRAGGRLSSVIGATAEQVGRDDVTVVAVQGRYSPEKLAGLLAMVADGRLTVPISATFPLDSATDALAAFASGKQGKIVVTP
jgi:NADPH:quinone reductase-like Zn-dependent oxidoreductase